MRKRKIAMFFSVILFLVFTVFSIPAQEWEKVLPPASFTAEQGGSQEIPPLAVPGKQSEQAGEALQDGGEKGEMKDDEEPEVGIEEKVEKKEREEIMETVPGSYTRPVRLPKVEGSRKPSRMELLFLGKISEKSQVLEQYGYDLFMPGPGKKDLMSTLYSSGIDKSYILGPGDEMQVFLSGEGVNMFRAQSKGGGEFFPVRPLPIDAEGKVFYPPIGMVHIWGKSISEAEVLLKSMVKKYIKEFQISVSLRKVRRFPVLVVGEVNSPGTVPVNGYSTVMDALILAGGVKRPARFAT